MQPIERERERERENELYLQSRHTKGQPPIYAGAYVAVHNNAHIVEKNQAKKTNNVYIESESNSNSISRSSYMIINDN